MRVGLDVSPLDQTAAGTARYLQALDGMDGVELVRLAHRGRGRVARRLPRRGLVPARPAAPGAARARSTSCTARPSAGPLSRPACPLVVTVHDLAVLRHPETFNQWTRQYSRLCVSRVVRAARLVIAVSEHTKRELVEMLATPPEKIRVVPNGVVGGLLARTGPAETGDYVLAVGTLEPRKNLARLADATRTARRRAARRRRRQAGETSSSGPACAGSAGSRTRSSPGSIAAPAASPIRRSYEGFGIPIVEAMASGTPVVTSRGGATEEVAGGAAVLVDPLDAASIAAGIEEAAARRDELVRAGLERARDFDWAETARRTADVYREALA